MKRILIVVLMISVFLALSACSRIKIKDDIEPQETEEIEQSDNEYPVETGKPESNDDDSVQSDIATEPEKQEPRPDNGNAAVTDPPENKDTAVENDVPEAPSESNEPASGEQDRQERLKKELERMLGSLQYSEGYDIITRVFIDSVYDAAFTGEIVGYEELVRFINEEIEPHKWEKEDLPFIYKIIRYFDIPRETFIEYNDKTKAFNEEYGTETVTFEDYVIEALYCGDEEIMKQTLKSPYVLYYNQQFYTIYDLFTMTRDEIVKIGLPQEELISYVDKMYEELKSAGYDNQLIKGYYDLIINKIQSAFVNG